MSAPAGAINATWGWLRSPSFDALFVLGTALLGCTFIAAVQVAPSLFLPLLALDLWLLGFHHVIATFTRLSFDQESFRQHRFHVLVLPGLVVLGTLALYQWVGAWAIGTLYFYWQGWHYLRQSYGVSRIYERSSRRAPADNPALAWVLYLIPLAGILYRSAQGSTQFLGFELRMLPVPQVVAQAAVVLAFGALVVWATLQLRALRNGAGSPAQTLYVATHALMFFLGYVLVPRLEVGWLGVNVWHNAQYLLIVWLYNNRRFGGRVDPKAEVLSTLSQRSHIAQYILVCLGLTGIIYTFVMHGLTWLPFHASIVVMQALNFHHYIVDAAIWKVRRPVIRRHLGLAS